MINNNQMTRRIKKVAIVGSGIMGSGIPCHFANIGVEVLLLDIVPRELNDKEKLEFYGLYKVATLGPVQGSQPSAISFVKRAKWDSWNTVANDMDQSQACCATRKF